NAWSAGQGSPIRAYAYSSYGWAVGAMGYENEWQRKHLGKADMVFCDGHAESLTMEETIGNGRMSHYHPGVEGMWTNLAGD
ncbi:MAG: hypothetical protein HQ546_03440, partial [Planctomycetes bacterium]|nr:hypothetical protein [Planctomycetota bacterium]